jgi:hypothetical protein
MLNLRLISADVLKLRRRRGMLAIGLLTTFGTMMLGLTVAAIQHASNPDKYGPVGGLANYHSFLEFGVLMAMVVGAIVGATAGAQDLESGVFRDLAATGRSRTALFASRVPAAWAVVLPMVALTAAAAGLGCVVLSGPLAAPGAGALIAGTAALLAAAALSAAIAVGVSALVGSRGPVIGILLAFELAISPLLEQVKFLGHARDVIPSAALGRIGDMPQHGMQVALGTAIVVVLAWMAVAFGVGAWKTRTREI